MPALFLIFAKPRVVEIESAGFSKKLSLSWGSGLESAPSVVVGGNASGRLAFLLSGGKN